MNIGERIKSLRLQRGLTQRQLAGSDVTRELISLIENGKCNPSVQTLQVISQKLEVTLDCFLMDGDPLNSVEVLLLSALKYLQSCKPDQALQCATKSLGLCIQWNYEEQMRSSYDLIGQSHELLGNLYRAIDAFEMAVQISDVRTDRTSKCNYLFRLGNCHFRLEDYKKAEKCYIQVVSLAEGLKSLQEIYTTALLYLGSCKYRLGDLASVTDVYANGYAHAKTIGNRKLEINALLGLGWMLHWSGHLDDAISLTEGAIQTSHDSDEYLLPQLQLNLGIYYSHQQRWSSAISLWNCCLEQFKDRGEWSLVASTLEEISRYHLHKNQVDQAKVELMKALNVLDVHENLLLKGRIFRVMASLKVSTGDYLVAKEFCRLSLFCFRLVGAEEEMRIAEDECRPNLTVLEGM